MAGAALAGCVGEDTLAGAGGASSVSSSSGGACPAIDGCHGKGERDPVSGACSTPALANGSSCDDGDGCTQSDACQAGSCIGAKPIVCTASDVCHLAGSCDSASGVCSNPADPKALGTFDARCGAMPVLLDLGYGVLGLLPNLKLPGEWNHLLIDGNRDGASRDALYERAHAVGLRPYWLVYANVFEGQSGIERARGKTPEPADPKGRGLADECGDATDYGGSAAACRSHYNACGGVVGESTPAGLAATFSDWFADGSLGYFTDSNTHRSALKTGLLPDAIPAPHIDLLQVDMEGECFHELMKRKPDAGEQAKALAMFKHVFGALESGLAANAIGAGTSPATRLGLYGVPAGQSYCSPYNGKLSTEGSSFPKGPGYAPLGYLTDECRYLVPQVAAEKCGPPPHTSSLPCAADELTVTSLGDGYAALGRLLPWMFLTGKKPWEHPAFSWLGQTDDGNADTYEGDDVIAWSKPNPPLDPDPVVSQQNYQRAFYERFFTAEGYDPAYGESTSLPSMNRLIGEIPGSVMFPSIYQSAGGIELAFGDVSDNDWSHNVWGRGAPAFKHKTSGHADPHVAKVFEHLLLESLETAQLANRVQLEIAWGWKLFTGRKLAPIITFTPGGAVAKRMERTPSDANDLLGKTVCTADDAIIRFDSNQPDRCGPKPPSCPGKPGYRISESLPRHPGRKLVHHRWNAALQKYLPDESDPNKHAYVLAGIEMFAHQTLDEFEYTQVRPMLQAVPHGEIDGVVNWPSATHMAMLCSAQGRRLKHGGGFHYLNAYGGYPDTGVPEPFWLRFFAPGPLTDWCHDRHEAECREPLDWNAACDPGDDCEPYWPSLASDEAIEELCTDAVASYALLRWERARKVFQDAQSSSPPAELAYQPTLMCGYLEDWFKTKLGMSPPKPMCIPSSAQSKLP